MQEASTPNRTLDLASALEIGSAGNKACKDYTAASSSTRSVMTIAFEFAFESHMQESVASMARQYVRSIISSVQRVALALSPSHMNSNGSFRSHLGTPEVHTVARWICHSYRFVRCAYVLCLTACHILNRESWLLISIMLIHCTVLAIFNLFFAFVFL